MLRQQRREMSHETINPLLCALELHMPGHKTTFFHRWTTRIHRSSRIFLIYWELLPIYAVLPNLQSQLELNQMIHMRRLSRVERIAVHTGAARATSSQNFVSIWLICT